MLSAPTSTAPAASSRRTSTASRARRRRVALDLRAGERRQAGDVEQVLHRERHAGQRQLRSLRVAVERVGALQRALGEQRRERVDLRVGRLDAIEARLHGVGRMQRCLAHALRDRSGVAAPQTVLRSCVRARCDRREHARRLVGRRQRQAVDELGHARRQRVEREHAFAMLGRRCARPSAAAFASTMRSICSGVMSATHGATGMVHLMPCRAAGSRAAGGTSTCSPDVLLHRHVHRRLEQRHARHLVERELDHVLHRRRRRSACSRRSARW